MFCNSWFSLSASWQWPMTFFKRKKTSFTHTAWYSTVKAADKRLLDNYSSFHFTVASVSALSFLVYTSNFNCIVICRFIFSSFCMQRGVSSAVKIVVGKCEMNSMLATVLKTVCPEETAAPTTTHCVKVCNNINTCKTLFYIYIYILYTWAS